jgi:hypothetical protein
MTVSGVRSYGALLRDEPLARAYLLGNLIDDVGVAVSLWAMQLLQTELMSDQHARAAIVVPILGAMVLGSLLSGRLTDGSGTLDRAALHRRRYRVLFIGRLAETLMLGLLVVLLASGPLTVARVVPYAVVSGFLKTALRPTKLAFSADILAREESFPMLSSLLSQATSLATLHGLLFGGALLASVHGRSHWLFAFDVLTNVAFLGALYACRTHPDGSALVVVAPAAPAKQGALRFLAKHRLLLWTLLGAWLVEMVAELYDGRMMLRHVLGGTAEDVRWAELSWTVVTMALVAGVPWVLRRGVRPERLFLAALAVDAAVMIVAGRVAMGTGAVLAFGTVLAFDRGLTSVASVACDVVQVRGTPAELRGRVAGVFQIVVLVTAMFAEGIATAVSDAVGIPRLVLGAGLVQGLVALAAGAVLLVRARRNLGYSVAQ